MHVSGSDTKDNKGKENDCRSPGNNTVLNFVPLCAPTKFTKQKITKEAKALKKESLKQQVFPFSNRLMSGKLRLLLFDSHLITSSGKCRSSARTHDRSSLPLFPSVY